jgi:MFS family permease
VIPQPEVGQDRRRWWALAALALSVLVVGLDLFVLSLALPTLSVDLHASSGDLQWFVDAYSLVLASALLPAGLLGDLAGRKRLLRAGLVVFGLASLGCAYSASTGELIAARALLGLAAAVITPLALAVLPVIFRPEERAKAIGIVGGATFLGYPLGPILGGWLLDKFWWGSVFLINVPIVVIALVTVAVLMPESRGAQRFRIDYAGVLISSVGLAALTYGVIRAGDDGWSEPAAVSTMAAGVVVLGLFVLWEWVVTARTARAPARGGRAGPDLAQRPRVALLPLVDLGLFRSAGFTSGTGLATMVSFALFGLTFAIPQYLLDVKGYDSLASGIRMLPLNGGPYRRTGDRAAAAKPTQVAGRCGQTPAGERTVAGRDWLCDHGRGPRNRDRDQRGQRHRVPGRVVRGDRTRARPVTAYHAERGAQRARTRAQRVWRSGDDSSTAGRRHDRSGRPRHRTQHRVPGPAAPGRAAIRRRRYGTQQRRHRRGSRAEAALSPVAGRRAQRLRQGRRCHALDLRSDRNRCRRARGPVPARPDGQRRRRRHSARLRGASRRPR